MAWYVVIHIYIGICMCMCKYYGYACMYLAVHVCVFVYVCGHRWYIERANCIWRAFFPPMFDLRKVDSLHTSLFPFFGYSKGLAAAVSFYTVTITDEAISSFTASLLHTPTPFFDDLNLTRTALPARPAPVPPCIVNHRVERTPCA